MARLGMDRYVLRGHEPVAEPDLEKWGEWMGNAGDERIVRQDTVGGVRVSTVFLGLDHNWSFSGPPVLFETMVFGGRMDQHQDRCSTWIEAEIMHDTMLAKVMRDSRRED